MKLLLELTEKNNANVVNYSKRYKVNKTKLINFIINDFFKNENNLVKFNQSLPDKEEKTEEVRVRFSISEKKLLKKNAENNSHSLPKEIYFRTIGTISKEPTVTEKELDILVKFSNSLNRIGNNVNQIARALNSGDTKFNVDEAIKNDIDKIKVLLEISNKKNREFIMKASNRWHYELEK